MPRMTKKYKLALGLAKALGLSYVSDHEELYRDLASHSYYWDADDQMWGFIDTDPNPATQFIRLRVWGNLQSIEDDASSLIHCIEEGLGWEYLERSNVYPCRPPNQLDGRVYLTFKPKDS